MVSMLVAFRQKILSRCWSVSLHRHSCCGAYRAHTRLFLVFYWSVTDFLLSGCSDTPLPPVSSERGYGLPRPPTRLASVGSSSFLVLSPICSSGRGWSLPHLAFSVLIRTSSFILLDWLLISSYSRLPMLSQTFTM